jgi:hypothetical protein
MRINRCHFTKPQNQTNKLCTTKKTKYENKQNTIQNLQHGLLQHRKRGKKLKIYIYRSEVRLSSLRKSRGGVGGAQKKTKYELRCTKPSRRGGGGRGAEERTESAGSTEAMGWKKTNPEYTI